MMMIELMRVWSVWPLGDFERTIDIGDNRNRRIWHLRRDRDHGGWFTVQLQRIEDWKPSWPFEPRTLRDYTEFLDDLGGYCVLDAERGLILSHGSQHLRYITAEEMDDVLTGLVDVRSLLD